MLKILFYFLVYISIVVVVVGWLMALKDYLSLFIGKPVFALWEQQRHRSACTSAQSDQHLCCSLLRQYNICSCYVLNFKIIASLCGCTGRFESYLVANYEDRFSCDEVHFFSFEPSRSLLFCGFMSQSTTMVMLRQSVNLTTLFLGKLPKRFTSAKCTFFCQ